MPMTLEKAIEILDHFSKKIPFNRSRDYKDALNLGIEALKLIAQEPPEGYTCIRRPLPGETEK